MAESQWTSSDLAAKHGELIRQLRREGLGRYALARAVTSHTRTHCSPGVMCRTMALLELTGAVASPVKFIAHKTVGAEADTITDVSADDPADGDTPIRELIEQRVAAARRKHKRAAAHNRVIEMPPRPTGLLILGDPHVDNEGCDWGLLQQHVALAQATPGVFAASVGDMTDNWIGRLQRLYAKASLRASDGWRLSQWLLEAMPWIALVGGNHDQWAHAPGVDPLKWISNTAKVMCYANDEIRLTLRWRGRPDLEPLVWILRHDFPGRSWFHPVHGPHKEAMLDGTTHLLTAGHIHQWGQLTTEQRHERVSHALRVRGYKRDDEHAKALGLYEQTHGAAALVVVNPDATAPSRMQIFWDIEHGCDYLTWMRSR